MIEGKPRFRWGGLLANVDQPAMPPAFGFHHPQVAKTLSRGDLRKDPDRLSVKVRRIQPRFPLFSPRR